MSNFLKNLNGIGAGTAIVAADLPAITATGDATGSGSGGSIPLILATVNSNIGTFASVTVNAKGLVTGASALSGDATTSGSVITLATVNSNIGTFNNVTVNGKGLVTAASNVAYLTANQTITLSGAVTGSGTTGITTTIANSAVTLAMLANLAANSVIGNVTGSSATPTAVSTLTTATASSVMVRDANANVQVNNIIEGVTTTATAAGTTTLTAASTHTQQFTGTTTQTVVLPNATTLIAGQAFLITNRSTGVVTVNANGGGLIQTMAAGSQTIVTVITVGTSAGTWDSAYSLTSGGSTSLTALGIFAGKATLSVSTTSKAVTFSTAYANTNYAVTATMLNTTDTNPQYIPVTITVQATTGFTASWNAPTPTANYVLSWMAIANN